MHQLQRWLEENKNLSGHFLFDEIYRLVEEVLEDGIITEDERDSLTSFMYEFTSNLNNDARTQIEMKKAESKETSLVSTKTIDFIRRMPVLPLR